MTENRCQNHFMNASVTDQNLQPVFRIAPTPSGFIHRGNAANFLLIWLFSGLKNGRILLRIDDLDRERMRPEYLSDVFRSLDKLGINYDFGPTGPDDFMKNWSQHTRLDLYVDVLDRLKKHQESYLCACTRSEMFKVQECKCKSGLKKSDSESCNYKITLEIDPSFLRNDFFAKVPQAETDRYRTELVFLRKNGQPAYHTASIVDDLYFGITHLVRGEDLMESSHAQLALAVAMQKESYLKVKHAHHPLIRSALGAKLAKSAGNQLIQDTSQVAWNSEQISSVVSEWLNLGSIGNKDELIDAVRESEVGEDIRRW